jgi:hypothetical protein
MSDELTDLYGVNELFLAGLAPPSLDVGNRRPRVKGSVDFDGVEALQVVLEPIFLWYTRIKRIPPFLITPA